MRRIFKLSVGQVRGIEMSSACRKSHELEQLLAGTLSPDESETITDHLASCTVCQKELERHAGDDWWWTETRPLVAAQLGLPSDGVPSSIIAVCAEGDTGTVSVGLQLKDLLKPPTHPELLGRLGKYEIESVIGEGGMGVVLKGFDTELNRTVAVKVLAPHLASNGSARQRFAREARAAAAVVHDHVIAIHGIESGGDVPYIVMPFVAGRSLEQRVRQHGPLPVIDVVRIAMQIASGLAAAHEQGLVHRDIKPANIMLEHGVDRVLITDFGLARAADDASITRSGLVAGTPHYMSPEQASGTSIDHRSDLFSLGSVMYFMATGRAPFRADGTMAVLHTICNRRVQPAQEVNAKVPAPLDLVICSLLKKPAAQRPESAGAVRATLAGYLAHLQNPTKNRLPRELYSSSDPIRTTLAAVAIGVSLLSFVYFLSGPGRAPGAAHDARDSTNAPRGNAGVGPANVQSVAALRNDSGAMVEFDRELNQLEEDVAQAVSWREESSHDSSIDQWERSCGELEKLINDLEQEWSTFANEQ